MSCGVVNYFLIIWWWWWWCFETKDPRNSHHRSITPVSFPFFSSSHSLSACHASKGATGYPLAATDLDSVDPSDDGHPADSDRQLQAGWSRSMRLKTIYLSIYPLRFRLIVSIEFQDPKTIKAIATIDSDRRKASLVLSSPLSSSSSLD